MAFLDGHVGHWEFAGWDAASSCRLESLASIAIAFPLDMSNISMRIIGLLFTAPMKSCRRRLRIELLLAFASKK